MKNDCFPQNGNKNRWGVSYSVNSVSLSCMLANPFGLQRLRHRIENYNIYNIPIHYAHMFVLLWFPQLMMTSSNGNIFRVTGPLCGEFTGDRWIPSTEASDAELWCFFGLRLNKRLIKQSGGWWFETPSGPLWRHCNETQQRSNHMPCDALFDVYNMANEFPDKYHIIRFNLNPRISKRRNHTTRAIDRYKFLAATAMQVWLVPCSYELDFVNENKASNELHVSHSDFGSYLGLLLLTCFNFNPSMNK